MDNKKKNTIVLFSCIAAVLFSVGVAFLGVKVLNFGFQEKEYEGVVVDGNYIDNETNNVSIYAAFTRIGDKLYYLDNSKGLYEISEDGVNRIYRNAFDEFLWAPRNINGELYCKGDESVKKYDRESGCFVDQSEIKDVYSIPVGDILVETGYDEYRNLNQILIIYKSELIKTIETEYYQTFYVAGDYVYYVFEGNKIRRFNVIDKTDELVAEVGDYWIYTIIVEDEKIVFDADEYNVDNYKYGEDTSFVFCIDLNDESKTLKKLFETDETININVCDNKVYISSSDGTLTKYDLKTSEQTRLCKKNSIYTCYIVDDKWVYFIDTGSSFFGASETLWRVTQDGTILEKVFG